MIRSSYILPVFLGICATNIITAEEPTKFYQRISSLEIFSFGLEFFGGEINETLNTGIRTNLIELGISSYKYPQWIFGFSCLDFSWSHKYDATNWEQNIITTYEIETKTTTAYSTTTTTKKLTEIKMWLYRFGCYTEYQPFIRGQKKISPFVRAGLSVERLSSDLPMAQGGYSQTFDLDPPKAGLGVDGKVGIAYRLGGGGSIRFGYEIGTLPDFDYQVLEGLRIVGGGISHTVFVAYGFHSFDRFPNNFKTAD
jgi:hypothetical protein